MKKALLLIVFSSLSFASDFAGTWSVAKVQCTEPSGIIAKQVRHTCFGTIVPKTAEFKFSNANKTLTLTFDRLNSFYFANTEIIMTEKIETPTEGKEVHRLNVQKRSFQFGNDFFYNTSPIGPFKSNLRVTLKMRSDNVAVLTIEDAIFTLNPEVFGEPFLKHNYTVQLHR